MAKEIDTIELKGNQYAKVKDRVKAFHEDYDNGRIITEPQLEGDLVMFKAQVWPDMENRDRSFTGHSIGKYTGKKKFEKLETVAVGRALAFAGLLADGEIATYDEMTDKDEIKGSDAVDKEEIFKKLEAAESMEELKKEYNSLEQSERTNSDVIKKVTELKKDFKVDPVSESVSNLDSVTDKIESNLKENDVKTIKDVLEVDETFLTDIDGIGSKTAEKIKQEAEDVLDKQQMENESN